MHRKLMKYFLHFVFTRRAPYFSNVLCAGTLQTPENNFGVYPKNVVERDENLTTKLQTLIWVVRYQNLFFFARDL